MTLLTHVKNNDQPNLKKHLSYLMKLFAYSIENSKGHYDSAEELMYFFVLDFITTIAHSFRADEVRHNELVNYIKRLSQDMCLIGEMNETNE